MDHKKFTLIITLKDRAEFTKRLCYYLSSINYPFQVLFADGSLEKGNEDFLEGEAKKLNFQYRYFRYPKDESLPLFYKKCADIISKVTTPYVMLADNDDFPIVTGQETAIKFLENNDDYVGCNGKISGLAISPDDSKPYGNHVMFLPYYCSTMDKPVLLNQDSALDRIKSFLTNFNSIYYSIFRTESLKKTLSSLEEKNFSDLGIHELFFSYSQLSQGKIQHIPEVTYIRQKGSSQAATSQKSWIDRLFYTDWLVDLNKALKDISISISKNEKLNEQQVQEKLYKDFVEKQKTRFIPNTFYILHNWKLFFNCDNLKILFSYKFFRLLPSFVSTITYYFLKNRCPKKELSAVVSTVLGENNA